MFCRTTKPRINNMCKYTTIFTIVDDFCKAYEDWVHHKLLTSNKQRLSDLSTVFRTKVHAIFCIFSYSTGDK